MLRRMDTLETSELMTIGRFSRITGLTVKALRHYDEVGLLRPAAVDPETGYRSYSSGQVRSAERIRMLRRLELPLDDIATLVETEDPALIHRVLVDHQRRTAIRSAQLKVVLQGLQPLIDGKESVMSTPVEAIDHRRLGVDLFNKTWTLMEKDDRTRGRGRRAPALRARVRVSLAAGRHAGESRAQRVAVLADVHGARPRGAGAPPRAPLPRDLRVESGSARGLGRAVRPRGAGPGPWAGRRPGGGSPPRGARPASWPSGSRARRTAACSRPTWRRSEVEASSSSNGAASSNGPIRARLSPAEAITSCATRCTSSAVTASRPASDLLGLDRLALEHLAAEPEHRHPLRVLEPEHEASLGERSRLLELVRGHGLVGDRAGTRGAIVLTASSARLMSTPAWE